MEPKETVIASWYTETMPLPFGDETVESLTRAYLASLFRTAAGIIENNDNGIEMLQEVEKITLSVRTLRWDKEFRLYLTKNREPTEDTMKLGELLPVDADGLILAEVPRLIARLEHACADLEVSVNSMEKHCAPVISATLKGESALESKEPALCPLAASLRACVWRIDDACLAIDSLRERMEL